MHRYHTISPLAAKEIILSQRVRGNGRIFAVAFERLAQSKDKQRDPGQLEVLYCRFNVKKHCKTLQKGISGWQTPDGRVTRYFRNGAKPVGAAYDRAEKGCFCAYVLNGKERSQRQDPVVGYRSIKFNQVRWLKIDGVVFKVGQPAPAQH